jgi:uncharacterized protein
LRKAGRRPQIFNPTKSLLRFQTMANFYRAPLFFSFNFVHLSTTGKSMTVLISLLQRCIRIRYSLVLLAASLVATTAFAQKDAPTCPAAPTQPSQEKIQELAKSAKDRGFLWKIEKDGRTSYLFGTMHVNKLEWSMPGAKTIAALRDSDVIALELDILDPKIQTQMSNPANFGIKAIQLSGKLKQRMEAVAQQACAPIAIISSMHPVMQITTVAIFDARFSGLEFGYGSEIVFSGAAGAMKKPVVGLETPEIQVRALMAGEVGEITEMVEKGLTDFETGKPRKQVVRLHNTWANGDLVEFEKYEEWCDCIHDETDRKFLKRINDDRNPGLAAGIDKLHRDGKRVFAAVGSLHMVGTKGIPALMKDMGYKIERVTFDNAASVKNEIKDEIKKEVKQEKK